jgi:hypothetical protein
MVGLAIESGSVGTNPETGLREYYVKIALPTGSGEVRWALLKDPLGNLVTYSPDFADTRGLRAELDSERGGIAETALDILTATPALSFARDVLTGDQRRQMRDVFPELDEGGQGAAFLMQALKIFQLPQMIPELLEMEDGEIQDIQRPLDPGESAQQRWMRSHLPQGAEAEMRLGRERGRQVSEGVQPGASRDQVSALAESLGINADPRFFELLEQLGSGALPGTGQARPKQLDPRGP